MRSRPEFCHNCPANMIDNPASWQLIALTVDREAEEAASTLLFDAGTNGILTLRETPETVTLGGYFEATKDVEEIARAIEAGFALAGLKPFLRSVAISTVPNQDWMQKWKEGFEPIEIGKRLVIAPSWKLPIAGERIVIQIDPGMAFGTGTHETTRMCLQLIEAQWRGGSLLDVGTGTGILAIAAARLAPGSRIAAIDIDPLAIEVATENIEINSLTAAIDLRVGEPSLYRGGAFDFVVGNLTAEVIIQLLPDLLSALAKDGVLVLSGILTTLALDVEQTLNQSGLAIFDRREAGEWSALAACRGAL